MIDIHTGDIICVAADGFGHDGARQIVDEGYVEHTGTVSSITVDHSGPTTIDLSDDRFFEFNLLDMNTSVRVIDRR